MSSSEDVLKAVQHALGPYSRTREEVSYIRRVLALHLESCLGDGAPTRLLSLETTTTPASISVAKGLQRDYLEALNANIKARSEYKACRQENKQPGKGSLAVEGPKTNHLQDHLTIIALQQKQQKLQAIERHLDLLSQRAAASQGFLDPNEMFSDSRLLPDVPRDIVTALALNDIPITTHLKDLIDQLEKHVMRAKLLLKREEQLLEDVRSRSSVAPGTVTNCARLEALNTSRTELIGWIEAELGKAGDGGGGEDDGGASLQQYTPGVTGTSRLDEQLDGVRGKYAHYLEARKLLLQLLSQQPKPVIQHCTENTKPPGAPGPAPGPSNHLLSPYLEQLLSIAHEQKGLIAQKSHLNITIAKQLKETCQALDHLAEESQLIPLHPMPGAARRKPKAFGDILSASETLDSSSRVKPWVFAAESAKITTLEAVAEKIEEGQIALESSMRTIGEIEQLLRPPPGDQRNNSEHPPEDDIWLAESHPLGKSMKTRDNVNRKGTISRTVREMSVWDTLDGNLGLLRPDGESI